MLQICNRVTVSLEYKDNFSVEAEMPQTWTPDQFFKIVDRRVAAVKLQAATQSAYNLFKGCRPM